MNLGKHNEWLWNSRWTHWWFKTVGHVTESETVFDPTCSGVMGAAEMLRCVKAFKRAKINAVLTEGLRVLVRFEADGATDRVIEAIRKATQACHRAGIKVIQHTTTVFAGHQLREISAARRKWLNIDARTGTYAYLDQWGGWYLWCLNNPEFRAEYFRLCKKVLRETSVDGFMADEVYFRTGWHNCACPHCRDKYRLQTGFTLPSGEAQSFWGRLDNPAFRAWLRFRSASVGDFYADLHATLRKAHPHPVLLGCHNDEEGPGNTQNYGDSNEERMRGVNLLFLEIGASSILYSWRRLSAEYMLYDGLSNYYGTPTMAVMYNPNTHEGFMSWALRAAHGIRVWATSGGGVLNFNEQLPSVPRDLALYGELFGWEEKHKRELAGAIRPLANIGVLLSAATRDMSDHGGGWNYYVRELMGWCEALTDEYLQYTVIVEPELTSSRLRQYALIVLPNAACLSDAAGRAVVEYVADGGSVILTHETGLYDETGLQRTEKRRLGRLLGIEEGVATGKKPWSGKRRKSARFGKHGRGKWVYFAHKPGLAVYTTTNRLGQCRARDTEDVPVVPIEDQELQRSLMIAAVRWATASQFPLTIKQAPQGLLVKAFHQRQTVVVHLLNCRGESVKYGEVIPANYPVKFPPLKSDVILELRRDSLKQAYLISPDWPGKKTVKVDPTDHGFHLTIPAHTLKRYAALYVS